MSWHLKVPKVCHVYWGGESLPYMRMLTVKSFLKYNPDWEVIVWTPSKYGTKRTWTTRELNYPVLCEDCTQELMALNITVKEFECSVFGDDISEVHKSDYLRLDLLANHGGVWSDMDIIYFKPMEELAVNIEANAEKDTFVCVGWYGHSAGFMMSAKGSKYFKALLDLTKQEFTPKEYQCIGPTMYNKFYPKFEDVNAVSPSVNIDMDAVYAHDAMHIASILDGSPAKFTNKSIGIHFYAGFPAWGEFMKNTNGGKGNLTDNVISNVLRQFHG